MLRFLLAPLLLGQLLLSLMTAGIISDASDARPGWDPNGVDAGPGWDPDGVNAGPGWDPNGG